MTKGRWPSTNEQRQRIVDLENAMHFIHMLSVFALRNSTFEIREKMITEIRHKAMEAINVKKT